MRLSPTYFFKNLKFLIPGLLIAGCTLEKKSAYNRSMQNLTARYNILFNANQLLREKQETMAAGFHDDYTGILSVYQDTVAKTTTGDKDIESVINKANTIISIKEQSHYIGDAYFLLGKANYLQSNYFNAIEFFSYTAKNFAADRNLLQDSRTWKARALMRLNQLRLADTLLDTAQRDIFPKQNHVADVFAARLQYDIYTSNYIDAEDMAKNAIRYTHEKDHRLRWTFILAQLQELNKKPGEAYTNYSHIINSNAPFEMAFNASLNRIRIQETKGINKISRIDLLRRLLKDDKNTDFTDQIYYQIAELYLAQNNIDEALKNYKLSAHSSSKNLNQKGIAYLRIAEINFDKKADYASAKKYYDSTLTYLSPGYPGYQSIVIKSANLQLLADRLQIIAREDTLQMLSKLNEKDRLAKVDQLIKRDLVLAQGSGTPQKSSVVNQSKQASLQSGPGNSSFYFYNAAAVNQGAIDFKRLWGDRPLTDNWRRSVKTNNDLNQNSITAGNIPSLNQPASTNDQLQQPLPPGVTDKARQDYLRNIPFTAAQIKVSNGRVYNAILDIANFYRDILNDPKQAITGYELLLARFGDLVNKPLMYYNLYRLYSNIDKNKSEYYKHLLLKNYPETDYARVIIDPAYNQKLNDKNAAFTAIYNTLFDIVAHRRYTNAADTANQIIANFPTNPYIAQVYYLRLIALGHQQKLDTFKTELKEIVDKFRDDRLITPLVKQHIAFIADNEAEISKRPFVLMDSDPNEVPFKPKDDHVQTYAPPVKVVAKTQPKVNPQVKPVPAKPVVAAPAKVNKKPADNLANIITVTRPANSTVTQARDSIKPNSVIAPAEAPSIFSMSDSTNYYFVINVYSNKINLAPSRFGIGQFNRANYQANSISHQIKTAGTNQLIYVGRFNNLNDARAYARGIVPLLPSIIKVPADKYNFFIITKQNLDKLVDLKTIDNYYGFYQKKY